MTRVRRWRGPVTDQGTILVVGDAPADLKLLAGTLTAG